MNSTNAHRLFRKRLTHSASYAGKTVVMTTEITMCSLTTRSKRQGMGPFFSATSGVVKYMHMYGTVWRSHRRNACISYVLCAAFSYVFGQTKIFLSGLGRLTSGTRTYHMLSDIFKYPPILVEWDPQMICIVNVSAWSSWLKSHTVTCILFIITLVWFGNWNWGWFL